MICSCYKEQQKPGRKKAWCETIQEVEVLDGMSGTFKIPA